MIRFDRGPAPDVFASERLAGLRAQAVEFYSQPKARRAQSRFSFQPVAALVHPPIRALWGELGVHKCAYCEQQLDLMDIDVFRPRQGAIDLKGEVSDDHYWWLAFEWSNYLPSCAECNALKGSRFPVEGPRAKVGAVGDDLHREHNLILDPSQDEVDGVFLYLDDGRVTSQSQRGQVTIDILGLNRSNLVRARQEALRILLALLTPYLASSTRRVGGAVIEYLETRLAPNMPFCAMYRQYIKAWAQSMLERQQGPVKQWSTFLDFTTALDATSPSDNDQLLSSASEELTQRTKEFESFSVEQAQAPEQLYRVSQYIERITLNNIRTVEHLELQPKPNAELVGSWFMLLGENGSGKSTLLQAVACALVGQSGVDKLGVKATDLLRHGAATGEVRIELSGMSEPIVMSLARRSNRITITPPEPKVMVLAYGATRLLGKQHAPPASIAQRSKIENLFDPTRLLDNGMPWLNDLKPDDFNRFARALASLLPRSDGVTLARRNRQIIVQSPSGNESLAVVSSGYQAVLALALDIMSVMRHGWQDMATAEGIVLIDEVDAHLHPRWRMRIVQRLREVFPRIQFIATSHEPLTLRGLDSNEIAVLTRRLDGQITALTCDNTQLPSPRHMRVDQLLASDYFGMHSTDDMDSELLFEEYYQLLAIKERTVEQDHRLQELRDELQADRRMGLTPRERLVFEAADQFIAQRMATSQALAPQVSQGAINELQSLWSELSSLPNDGQEDQA